MIQSLNHLASLLNISKVELKNLADNTDNYYYEKKEPKTDQFGKQLIDQSGLPVYRLLRPSKGLLKSIQSKIKGRILDKHSLSAEIYGGVKGKDNIYNGLYHKGSKYFLITDLRKFYPSISYKRVYKLLIDLSYSSDVARILTRLCTDRGCLPQGTPTSTSIANLSFQGTDLQLASLCTSLNVRYTRFVDDLTFSASHDFKDSCQKILSIVAESGFKIARNKTGYKIGPTKITGVVVHNNYLDTLKEFEDTIVYELSDSSFFGKISYKRRVEAVGKSKRAVTLTL